MINRLKIKAGDGLINKIKIDRAQNYLDQVDIDISNIIYNRLKEISKYLENDNFMNKSEIAEAIMDIKSISGVTKHELIKSVSVILLNFLEEIEELDKANIKAIQSYQMILNMMIIENISRVDTPEHISMLTHELDKNIGKYLAKHINRN